MAGQRDIIQCANDANGDGIITGGSVDGAGIRIIWQDGPLMEGDEPNGAFVQSVIRAALQRIQSYQASPLSCRENAMAITKLEEAPHWLQHRWDEREARGVQGQHVA